MASAQQSFEFPRQEELSRVQTKPEESSDMARIVIGDSVFRNFTAKAEDKAKKVLSELGIPIFDMRGQIRALLSSTDAELSDIQVQVKDIEAVRNALTDALETHGLEAKINRADNEIEIGMAPSEDPRESIGYQKKT